MRLPKHLSNKSLGKTRYHMSIWEIYNAGNYSHYIVTYELFHNHKSNIRPPIIQHDLRNKDKVDSEDKNQLQVLLSSQHNTMQSREQFCRKKSREPCKASRTHFNCQQNHSSYFRNKGKKIVILSLHPPYFSPPAISQFGVCLVFFVNVMIFKVNFLNFHECRWNTADYPNKLFLCHLFKCEFMSIRWEMLQTKHASGALGAFFRVLNSWQTDCCGADSKNSRWD